MATITASKTGPIRTTKTPKRVRFAGEDRAQTKLLRQREAVKRDARHIPRVDVGPHSSKTFYLLYFPYSRSIPRLDKDVNTNSLFMYSTDNIQPSEQVDITTSYDIPTISTAAGALFGYAKTTLNSAKSTLDNVVELGKSALTSSFTSSFGQISLSFHSDKHPVVPAQQQQASMLEYPPFLAGATP